MENRVPLTAERPQFSLQVLLICVTLVAVLLGAFTQLGGYSAALMPLCVTLFVAIASGGTWRDALLLALYVYGVAALGIVVLAAMLLAAVVIGMCVG